MKPTAAPETAPPVPPTKLITEQFGSTKNGPFHYRMSDSKGQFFDSQRANIIMRIVTSACIENGVPKIVQSESYLPASDYPTMVMVAVEATLQKSSFMDHDATNVIHAIRAVKSSTIEGFNKLTFTATSEAPLDIVCRDPAIKAMRAAGTPVKSK